MAERNQIEQTRRDLVEQLYRGLGESRYRPVLIRSLRTRLKTFCWITVVHSTKLFKRAMDVVLSTIGVVVLMPLFAAVAFLIWLEDRGPVFFFQTRIGQWGQEFRLPKFRSMVVDAEHRRRDLLVKNEHGDGVTFKMKRDPRITRIGAVLRKLSIDELPQLWCVLRGEMSLVGPRPPLPVEVARYGLGDRRRLEVKPGLTCIWQVSGRAEIPFEQQVRLDAQYVDSHSPLLDLSLLLKTIPAILTGRGAY